MVTTEDAESREQKIDKTSLHTFAPFAVRWSSAS